MKSDDFVVLKVNGYVKTYRDEANSAIAIDSKKHQEKWGAAMGAFLGETGTYDVTITILAEVAGSSSYRLEVRNERVGKTVRSPKINSKENLKRVNFTWCDVEIRKGDLIVVISDTQSNGTIEREGISVYSRGRWKELFFLRKD